MKPLSLPLPELDWAAIDALAAGRALRADSRQVRPGDVFFACRGEQGDAREANIRAAILGGASAILWELEDFSWPADLAHIPNLGISQLRLQAGMVAARLLGQPSRPLHGVGITGTNGKTSCAHWLAQAYTLLGERALLLGTIGYGFIGNLQDASHTTPDALRLQNLIADYAAKGATRLCMEVASHGLAQGRAHGVMLQTAVFTNLTRDHLDYHGDMAAYGESKARLFDWEGLQHAVINADDPFGAQLCARQSAAQLLSYGLHSGDLRCERLQTSLDGLLLEINSPWGRASLRSPLIGRFNAYNLLACLGVLLCDGVPLTDAVQVLGQIESAKGRMQRLGGYGQPLVIVDYAHTPDALENALTTLQEALPTGAKLICVFGCGGDRDRGKRPLMGKIACRLADTVLITSDNPRTEDPRQILQDIVAGVDGASADHLLRGSYSVEGDRAAAIAEAVAMASSQDIVLIAGKGHEEYQDIGGVKHDFSDAQHAQQALDHWRQQA